MVNRVLHFFNNNKLELKNKKIVAAVSTGIDSMVMLDILIKLRAQFFFTIYVAHVNHRKRIQTKDEEKYIKSFCLSHNIKCYVYRLESVDDENFQNYAHRKRYGFFNKLMDELTADYLLLAHHADDNIETIIMRIIRGSNLKGYAGIAPLVNANNFLIVRPLSDITKKEIITYADQNKIKYCQDRTNFQSIYTRNRIRKKVVPYLFKEDANVQYKFRDFSETLVNAWKVVAMMVNDFIEKSVTINKDRFSFLGSVFTKLSGYLQYEVLFSLLKEYELRRANIAEIIKLINSSKKNHKLFYKNLFTFVKEYDKISIYHRQIDKLKVDFEINDLGCYRINDTMAVNVFKSNYFNILNLNEIWYNINMLPIRIRSRKPGDKILLAVGYKKIKDILIDKKIGILQREKILIFEKDGEILAIPGIAVSKKLQEIKNKDILIKVEYNDG